MLRVQPDNLHIHYSLLNHWIIKWARKKGIQINSYTINDKNIYNNVKLNIDGVFTDNIEYLK
jgi:glycerophosphoryl diester phosphodiesterase